MAKLTLSPIGSFSQAAITTINQNMDDIETALENTLSRDGTTPNQMTADLDMNDNDILNVDNLNVNGSFILNGEVVIPGDISAASAPELLELIKTVDGAGSGLDADLLDGNHGGAFVLKVTDRTALKAVDTTIITSVNLLESGREGLFTWRTGDFSAQITADTQEGIYIKSNAIASTAGAWVRQRGGFVKAEWFGLASANSGSVNRIALLAAANFARAFTGHLEIGEGDYTFDAAVSITMTGYNDSLHITGAGYGRTNLRWPSTDGISITMVAGPWWFMESGSAGNAISIEGLSFVTSGTGDAAYGKAISISGNNSSGRPPPNVRIENCVFRSATGASCWSVGILLTSASSVNISKCFWYGCSNNRIIGTFVSLVGSSTHDASPFHIRGCEAYYFETAVLAGSHIEGIHVTDSDFVSGKYGVLWATTDTQESQLCMVGCHVNATTRCVWLQGVQHSQITGNLFFTTAASSVMVDMQDSSYATITGNTLSVSDSTIVGILFRSSAWVAADWLDHASAVNGNTIIGCANGIECRTTVRNIAIGSNAFVGCTNNIIDADSANGALGAFLAEDSLLNWANGGLTIQGDSSTGAWIFGGTAGAGKPTAAFPGRVRPTVNDNGALGAGTIAWSDLFLADGGVINWNNGNYTVTHSTGQLVFSGALVSNTSILSGGFIGSNSATAGIGYLTGAGGTVTQATSKSTGVTLNKACGEITMNNASLAANTTVQFTLTNSAIAATDVLVLNHVSSGTLNGYILNASCAAGSATIYLRNSTAGALADTPVIRFAVIKGVTA